MEKVIKLYALDRDNNIVPFPSFNDQVEIGNFKYNSTRMGGAPTLSATVMWSTCLDEVWNDESSFIKESVFALFNGEKYFLKQTPTSSYSNEEARYKHELELISERMILDNVYFYDVVSGVNDGKPVSNSTKVVFSGDIEEFVQRLNASLIFTGLQNVDEDNEYVSGYRAVIDEGVESEDKLLSFEDSFFSNVLQEIYNQYELPYYFDGKTIHIGYSKDIIVEPFAQGISNALLSISKQNANNKVVNRVTGLGSTDNIPFYYPNKSPKGDLGAVCSNIDLNVEIINTEDYSNKIGLDKEIKYTLVQGKDINKKFIHRLQDVGPLGGGTAYVTYSYEHEQEEDGNFKFSFKVHPTIEFEIDPDYEYWAIINASVEFYKNDILRERREWARDIAVYLYEDLEEEFTMSLEKGPYTIKTYYTLQGIGYPRRWEEVLTLESGESYNAWTYDDKEIKLRDVGLKITGTPQDGDTITQRLIKRVDPSSNLMPSIYRGTNGKQRFYNAVNGGYTIDGYTVDFGDITFNNPWVQGKPKEQSVKFEDIKPTIKEATYLGQRIDMFLDVVFDEDEDNDTYEDEGGNTNIKHPYFFVKLHKLGFNLFDHAIEQQPMVVSMTSGDCGSCKFEIAVDEQDDGTFVNTVQVDENGDLVRDENGRVLCGVEDFQDKIFDVQESQQDTTNNEVWIALRKEESTFGLLMPHAPKEEDGILIEAEHRPKPNEDTFVLLGINLPESYILEAEKKLEDKLFEYLSDNNDEKFNFRITFSRIYFEENPTVLQHLNENSCVSVVYNGKTYDSLYVSSFSYSMSQSEVLPQITVELKDSLSVSQNAVMNAISEVKGDVTRAINNLNVLGRIASFVLRKDIDDIARGVIDFKKGVKFGEGGKVEILDNNSAKLTIEYLEVTKKATFTALEIQERTHVGGQLLVTPAAMNCGEVEEFDTFYRCYFQTKGEKGDEIYNQFVVGDQAICQTYNVWGSKYYWRLVIEVGKDYIDLSKSDCDEGSDSPTEGDKIIQLGNRDKEDRQNAIILASHGDGSPYFVQYRGINNYDLPKEDNDPRLVTKFSPEGNLITGKVKMVAGSEGLEQFTEWIEKQEQIDEAQASADEAMDAAEAAQEDISNLQVGGTNFLRNTGFTGDFLSEQLSDEKVLDTTTQMYSPWDDHWTHSNGVTLLDDIRPYSASGKGIQFDASLQNQIHQIVDYSLTPNATYIVSFKARSTTPSKPIDITVGGNEMRKVSVTVRNTWDRYVVQATAGDVDNSFLLKSSSIELCELQLELGNKATSWKPNPLDNGSDRAYWQSMKYLQQSVQDASTTFIGGLGLTQTIMVGNYDRESKEMTEVTGGMSGVYNNANDIAFWGGGTYQQAAQTAQDYLSHGDAWQPTQEQIAQMAQFVVTHGGKAILNNVIAHGTIYATDGFFTGEIQARSGTFNGEIKATSQKLKLSTPNTNQPIDGIFIDIDEGVAIINEYILPQLEHREVMVIEAASNYPLTTASPSHIVTNGGNEAVTLRVYNKSQHKFSAETDYEFEHNALYKLVGIGKSPTSTVWAIYKIMAE